MLSLMALARLRTALALVHIKQGWKAAFSPTFYQHTSGLLKRSHNAHGVDRLSRLLDKDEAMTMLQHGSKQGASPEASAPQAPQAAAEPKLRTIRMDGLKATTAEAQQPTSIVGVHSEVHQDRNEPPRQGGHARSAP